MKTKAWSPSPYAPAGYENHNPLDWLKTKLLFTKLHGAPSELEIMSAIYQVHRHLRERVPFTLTLESGEVLATFSQGELVMDDVFRTPFHIFDQILSLEKQLAVQGLLDEMSERLDATHQVDDSAGTQALPEQPQPAAPEEHAVEVGVTTEAEAAQREPSDDIRSALSGPNGQSQRGGTNRRRR